MSSSIETLTFHASIIFLGCFLAYAMLALFKQLNIPGLKSISVWAYGIIVMFAIWGLIKKAKLDFLIDSKAKGKITGPFTEFAVIAAIASLPIKTVLTYLAPILVMAVLGYIVTSAFLLFTCKKYLKVDWFEHMIATLGMSTGVFLTGLLLLRICDPDSKSTALGNYSVSFSITSAATFATMPIILSLLLNNGAFSAMAFTGGLSLLFMVLTVVSYKLLFGKKQ